MAKPWTLERLTELSQVDLETLFRNAQSKSGAEAENVIGLIQQHALISKIGAAPKRRASVAGHTLTKPWSPYRQVIIETYAGPSRGTRSNVRARPVAGEFYPSSMNVECSTDMRKRFAVGTKFRIYAKETTSKDGQPFLYTHFSWPADVVTD